MTQGKKIFECIDACCKILKWVCVILCFGELCVADKVMGLDLGIQVGSSNAKSAQERAITSKHFENHTYICKD